MPDLARLEAYLRPRLEQRRLSLRALSLGIGRDATYLAGVFNPRQQRAAPDPDDLRRVAAVLAVPFGELLDATWGVTLEELQAERAGVAAPRDRLSEALAGASPEQQDLALEFIEWMKARGVTRSRPRGDPGGGGP